MVQRMLVELQVNGENGWYLTGGVDWTFTDLQKKKKCKYIFFHYEFLIKRNDFVIFKLFLLIISVKLSI